LFIIDVALDLKVDDRQVADAIAARFPGEGYVAFHAPRYVVIIREIERQLGHSEPRILDIGATAFTQLLHEHFGTSVDSLGFAPDEQLPRGRQFHFDLNDSQWHERWRVDMPTYDVVILAEVLEHLHTAPRLVLSFLHTLLKPDGILVVQTPNAARLGARLKLLVGKHPYAQISEDVTEPDHFREYTESELRDICARAGFEVLEVRHASYFDNRFSDHRDGVHRSNGRGELLNRFYARVPKGLQPGITLVARRIAALGS